MQLVIVGASGMVGAYARVLRGSSPNGTFAFFSAGGADPTGRSRVAYARYKGEAEKALATAARGSGEGRTLVVENRDIRHLAGLVPRATLMI